MMDIRLAIIGLGAIIANGMITGSPYAAELTLERLVASPSLNGPSLRGLQLSPDGRYVTYLQGKENDFRQMDLWAYNTQTNETKLLVDSDWLLPAQGETIDAVEQARRERQRITTTGITEYSWSPNSDALLFPVSGDIYYYDFSERPRRLTTTPATETDAKISPAGNYISYIREQNIYIYDLVHNMETAFTKMGGGDISFGMAQFVVQEELDRFTGYWWQPGDKGIAYTKIDERHIPELPRYEIDADGITVIQQRYPRAGTKNAMVQLFYSPVDKSSTTQIDLGRDPDIYLARVKWQPKGTSDEQALWYQRLSRNQKTLDLMKADISTGQATQMHREQSDIWVNLNNDFRFIDAGRKFIWASEKSGYKHLYLHDSQTGRELYPLTSGPWAVDQLNAVDETAGKVYFTGFADAATQSLLYSVPLQRNRYTPAMRQSRPARLSRQSGWHETTMRDDAPVYLDQFSAPDTPPQIALINRNTGLRLAWLKENKLDASHPYWPYRQDTSQREFFHLTAEDGQRLDFEIMKPADFDPAKTYPAIIHVYGGPHASMVKQKWSLGFDDILTRNGYIVFKLDNRGASNRGFVFEQPIYRHLGGPEVTDQKAGADYLAALPYIDAERIGVWGWSYGGYMTVMMLAKNPETYAAGVAVAPVSDWSLYDTAYTERYMGTPQENTIAYENSSHFPYIAQLDDPLFIVHGMADDNVFFDHSVKLFAALQQENIAFDMMTYPGKKHGIRGEVTRLHLWTDILDFFDRELKH
ncbi:MAG: DPP IV N-terminal domain-containing protein [bacterium]